jgi:hypothetical protein
MSQADAKTPPWQKMIYQCSTDTRGRDFRRLAGDSDASCSRGMILDRKKVGSGPISAFLVTRVRLRRSADFFNPFLKRTYVREKEGRFCLHG